MPDDDLVSFVVWYENWEGMFSFLLVDTRCCHLVFSWFLWCQGDLLRDLLRELLRAFLLFGLLSWSINHLKFGDTLQCMRFPCNKANTVEGQVIQWNSLDMTKDGNHIKLKMTGWTLINRKTWPTWHGKVNRLPPILQLNILQQGSKEIPKKAIKNCY